ncbi:hypothetical protein EPI10_023686 [Gossypium australe]|uniref:Uncharacterized protein n=1 Tax=Gossypium australe TaxID=47621 RepID=A0A5B6VWI6_9ROSI|nr:hypothetical protein EPI10_023686 [Gossypium australe]
MSLEPNPKDNFELVTLRSERNLEPKEVEVEDEPPSKEVVQYKLNFHNLHVLKESSNKSNNMILNSREPTYQHSVVEALEQMLNYAKAMKEFLSKKRKLEEFETNKLPPKLKDPRSFTIHCNIGESYCGKALYDLGSSINLMPTFVFRRLGIDKARPITVTLQLADQSLAYLKGTINDVLVRVDKFIFPGVFIILDFDANKKTTIILRRPFLAIGRMIVDV